MQTITITGEHLIMEDVAAVARGAQATLSPIAVEAMERSWQGVQTLLARGEIAYGITTGFGAFKGRIIPQHEVAALQRNLILSHAAGVGPDLDAATVRAIIAVRANTLAMGHSGIRPQTVAALLELLNRGVLPRIPAYGSVGASGDLAPLAHLACVLIGEGEAHYEGELLPGGEALRRAGLEPVVLEAKEGLALINGTTVITTIGALVTLRAENLIRAAYIAGALSLEALRGTPAAFDARVHLIRPHPRQVDGAAYLRRLLAGSTCVRPHDPRDIQDAYSLRCMPQVHGAICDTISYARWALEIELNAVTDNPLIFFEDDGSPTVISGGNFHAEPVALALDYLKLGLADLGNISERRTARLVDESLSNGLPPFLTRYGGLESGLMLAQYTAAALASENKVLAHPSTADTIPTSANTEDHVSMGANAAHHARQVLENVETIVAIELLAAAQGVDFRCEQLGSSAQLGKGTRAAYDCLREHVPFLEHDRTLSPLIEAARALIASGELVETVEAAL
ncbi:MAG TPA: histidine ammonia-lyase [Chloroflexi bacterium]|nr:histidine ammonia-lyase [Chloroflexota bacterium]